jgi:hypothetical protein
MSASSSRSVFSGDQGETRANRTDPVIRRRRLTALVQTVIALAIGVVMIAAYGRDGLTIYFSQLPVALGLLWASTDSERFDERPDSTVVER